MNDRLAYVITGGSLVAMYLGYNGSYIIGILGCVVYAIAWLCALIAAAMRGDTAIVLCIIFVPIIGLFCAIAKYCNSVSAISEERWTLFLVGGAFAFGGSGLFGCISNAREAGLGIAIFVSLLGVVCVLAGTLLILGAVKLK